MGLNDYIVSVIRTLVPTGVGSLLTFLAAKTGVLIDEASSTAVIGVFTTLAVGGYYVAARYLEGLSDKFGWLLGAPKKPTYTVE